MEFLAFPAMALLLFARFKRQQQVLSKQDYIDVVAASIGLTSCIQLSAWMFDNMQVLGPYFPKLMMAGPWGLLIMTMGEKVGQDYLWLGRQVIHFLKALWPWK